MIEFVDIKTGKVFNGESPYVFWFEGGQSVNLNYVNKICFISDHQSVDVSIDSPVFSILNLGQNLPNIISNISEVINAKSFIDLESIKVAQCPMAGYRYNGLYVYMLYILAHADEGGEIRDTFTISDASGDHVFTVGADFYVDNELLTNQLGNFDVNIPESIQKAIYDMDVHEEANDNILLNRKYKELLMNYWDIVANKGSYNSLQNSLAWFEWGDLVRMEEIWSRHHEGLTDYFSTIINRPLNDEFVAQLLCNSKTTYIGLYMAINHLTGTYADDMEPLRYSPGGRMAAVPGVGDWVCVEDPDATTWVEVTDYSQPCSIVQVTPQTVSQCSGFQYVVYPNWVTPDHTPDLGDAPVQWELIDIYLKMTLLGNFFSTFFMPVHMDLIHSTAERWVFTNLIKILLSNTTEQNAWVVRGRRCGLIHNTSTYIKDYVNHPWSGQLFLGYGDVFGFCGTPMTEPNTDFNTSGESMRYPLGGFFGMLHFSTDPDDPMKATDVNDVIYRQRLSWSGSYTGTQDSRTPIYPNQDLVYDISFDLAFRYEGEYNIYFEFYTTSGNIWTYSATVTINDNAANHVDMYRIQRLPDAERATLEIAGRDWNHWLDCFQMHTVIDDPIQNPIPNWPNLEEVVITGRDYSPYRYYHPYREHSIFVSHFGTSIGMNQTIIMDVCPGDSVWINDYQFRVIIPVQGAETTEVYLERIKRVFDNDMPGFIWITTRHFAWSTYQDELGNTIPEGQYDCIRIIGVCRDYDTEPIEQLLFEDSQNQVIPRQHLISLRFQPFMHSAIPFTENETPIGTDVLLYMEPHLGYSKDVEVSNWEFRNMTTQKSYTSHLTEMTFYPDGRNYGDFGEQVPGGMRGLMVAPQTNEELESGYYNITINYMKESVPQHFVMDSAFIMAK